MKIKNKIALVTGGTKGIGLGIVEALLENGAKVMITSRTQSDIDEVVNNLNERFPGHIAGFKSNVVKPEEMNEVISEVNDKWGPLDILIANAGVGHFAPIDELNYEEWNDVIDINLTGVFNTVKASLDDLKKTKGYIITIASLAGTNFFAGGAAYNASKFGLVGFTQAIMLDLRYDDVKCSTIMPGSVATYFNDHVPGSEDDWKIQPEDIGELVIDLLKMNPRTLPSKIEVRPSKPPKKS